MKAKMAAAPMANEISPERIESAPSSAPTVRCSCTFSFAGKAPDRKRLASWLALSCVKLPVISPDPPVIAL